MSLVGISVALFVVSAALTAHWCLTMPVICAVPMPGGWMMSIAWLRKPGQTWVDAASSFLSTWTVMMVPMMLPSLTLALSRLRGGAGRMDSGWQTMLTATAYFLVWAVAGLLVFPPGAALAAAELRMPGLARAEPFLVAVVLLGAGGVQFTAWKARWLARCRGGDGSDHAASVDAGPVDAAAAWRRGVSLGLRCCRSCANLTAILFALGVMDLRAMTVVAVAITAERLAPNGRRMARASGAVAIGAGLLLLARAAGVGA